MSDTADATSKDEPTRTRIILAAKAEFAQHGFSGARIDRIAQRARTSKERLYVYFRTKQALYRTVGQLRLAGMEDGVRLDGDDLVGFVGRFFDYFSANPEDLRLGRWASFDAPADDLVTDDPRVAVYRSKVEEVRDAQARGVVDPSWNPADLLNLLSSIAIAWLGAPGELKSLSAEPVSAHRAAAVEAARRLVTPPGKAS